MSDRPVPDRPRTVLFCGVLIAAPLFEIAEALLSPLTNGSTGQDVAAIAAEPGRFTLSVLLGTAGSFLLLPVVLGLAHRASARSPRLALVAAVVSGLFALSFAGLRASQGVELAIATGSGTITARAAQVDAALGNTITSAILMLFLVTNVVGLVLLAIALWRSRRVPVPAVVLFLLFPIIDLTLKTEGGVAIAHLVLLAATSWMAIGFLRSASPRRLRGVEAAAEQVAVS
jgi:hypothetical protein